MAKAVRDDAEKLASNTYFANCLQVAPASDPLYNAPSQRVVLGPLAIYTFEFDQPALDFFRQQLSWLRSKDKKKLDCPMGDFYKSCSKWTDFRGLTVCWSGHKSLHIHAVFETSPYIAQFGDPGENARSGMIAHWDKLEAVLLRDLFLTNSDLRPDPQLKFPEQYRRLPNGLREVDKDEHILGVPRGTIVPQITLWEQWRDRSAKNSTALFHSPKLFAPSAQRRHAKVKSPSDGGVSLTQAQIAHCENRLREVYPDHKWPRLARLGYEGGYWNAWFFNSETDENPSSFLRDDYRTIKLQGRETEGLSPTPLAASLGECMTDWLQELGPDIETTEEVERTIPSGRSKLALSFMASTARCEASEAMDYHLPRSIWYKRWLLIQAPEGASKTSTIMRHHPWIVSHLHRLDERISPFVRQSLYAFGSYDEAQDKCTAFNFIHSNSEFVGVLLPSFSREYQAACAALGLTPISQADATLGQHPSLWTAIEAQQPQAIEWLEARHKARWAEIGNRSPVWFTVHQVAHGWHKSTPTRLMAAKSFWSLTGRKQARQCREETHLSLLIHDEIKTSTFVFMASEEERDWIDKLRSFARRHWSELDLSARVTAFQHMSIISPPPSGLDFDKASRLANVSKWDEVMTADTGEYALGFGDRDIYQSRHGHKWYCSPTRWWRDADALRVVFLTTEEVPTAAAERADRSISVWRLDAPNLNADDLHVYPERGVTGANLKDKIDKWRKQNGEDWFAISNKLGDLPDSMTHARARGSNNLIGRKIVQTMTFMTPQEYEELQALNAWCGRDDLVLLRHIDECNQSAGRNLGFRHRPGAENALLINPNLMKLLHPILGHSRYDFCIHVSKNQQRTIRRNSGR